MLVSIPVLDKVLPLKHLAQELLYRGYRVGFALPEVPLDILGKKILTYHYLPVVDREASLMERVFFWM